MIAKLSSRARKRDVPAVRLGLAAATAVVGIVPALVVTGSSSLVAVRAQKQDAAAAPQGCQLNSPSGAVSHVISLVFDNVHFSRDNPNVPSDLEQMPNLLNFLKQNGVLLSNMHTPLIAHTADDILTTLTGVYGDKHGQPVSNSFRVFNHDGSSSSASSFTYWTDPVANKTTTDTLPSMIDPRGKVAPAPWVPFTRAGCDVGGFSTANIEVENSDPDLKSIYGANSPQWHAVLADEAAHGGFADLSNADYQGIAVHCAQNAASICSRNPSLAAPDKLLDEPGGYNGYSALYGNVNVGPAIGGTPVSGQGVRVDDLNGDPLTNDFASGDIGKPYYGFPGFSPTAAQSLAYIADMQEHGIPVTYGYLADVHANEAGALGPGDPAYVANLQAYDKAFGQFFARLQSDGITPANTVFIVSSDEGDHFAGTQHPTPAGCDGVTTSCTYAKGAIGEVSVNLAGLLKEQDPTETSTDFQIHSDSAPNFYINGNPEAGAPRARQLEHEMASLLAPDPYVNNGGTAATIPVTKYMADQVEETILHYKTTDPKRLPTFTDFANPDFYITKGSSSKPCPKPFPSQTATNDPCVVIDPGFAWNHGDIAPEINNNWAGIVGPDITARGVDSTTWADETDVRPTLMALTGLQDDYRSDGRVLWEDLSHSFTGGSDQAGGTNDDRAAILSLARAYKQLNADVGAFGVSTLIASTRAVESSGQNDSTYTTVEGRLAQLGGQRDTLANEIADVLNGVDRDHHPDRDNATRLTNESNAVIARAGQLAADNSI